MAEATVESLTQLSQAASLPVQVVTALLRFTCIGLQALRDDMMVQHARDHDDVRRQIARNATFVRVNGTVYPYGVIDDNNPEQTRRNLRACYNDSVRDLNADIGSNFMEWSDVVNVGDIIERSPSARKRLQDRCVCRHVMQDEERMRVWLRSSYRTLSELNTWLGTSFRQWSEVYLPVEERTKHQQDELLSRCNKSREILDGLLHASAVRAVREDKHIVAMLPTSKDVYALARFLQLTPGMEHLGGVERIFVVLGIFAIKANSHIPLSVWYALMLAFIARSVDTDTFQALPVEPVSDDDSLCSWVLDYYGGWGGDSVALDKMVGDWGRKYASRADLCSSMPPTSLPSFDSYMAFVTRSATADTDEDNAERVFVQVWGSELPRFSVRTTEPNGDCFFEALSAAIDESSATELRKVLADALPRLVSTEDGVEGWKAYRNHLRDVDSAVRTLNLRTLQGYVKQPRHWATDQDLRIFSQLFNIHFILLNWDGQFDCVGHTDATADAYVLLFYERNYHYDLVVRDGQGVFTRAELPESFFARWESLCGDVDLRAPIHPLLLPAIGAGGDIEAINLHEKNSKQKKDVSLPDGWTAAKSRRRQRDVVYFGPKGQRVYTVREAWEHAGISETSHWDAF